MIENSYLGIKIGAMVSKQQEKIVKLTMDSKDTLDEVHKYRLFTDALRSIIKEWEPRI